MRETTALRGLPIVALLLGAVFVAAPVSKASAVPVTIAVETDYIISSILGGGLFAGFTLNEQIAVRFTIDDTTPDSDPDPTAGLFQDPNGFFEFIGVSSGASVVTNNGVEIGVDRPNELELDGGIANPGSQLGVVQIGNDIDFNEATVDIFSNPNLLTAVIADLLGTHTFASANTADVTRGDGMFQIEQAGFEVGNPHDATFSVVSLPEPASLSLLGLGLFGFGVARLHRKGIAQHRAGRT